MGDGCSFDATTTYQTLQCLGCEAVTFKRKAVHSEMGEFDQPDIAYYPPRVSRSLPGWLDRLDYEDKDLMEEIWVAAEMRAGAPCPFRAGARREEQGNGQHLS